ncbi:MAG: hypothetical protein U0836_18840 [Pirellulales bacterium]
MPTKQFALMRSAVFSAKALALAIPPPRRAVASCRLGEPFVADTSRRVLRGDSVEKTSNDFVDR